MTPRKHNASNFNDGVTCQLVWAATGVWFLDVEEFERIGQQRLRQIANKPEVARALILNLNFLSLRVEF
jgi:hypothetical protein